MSMLLYGCNVVGCIMSIVRYDVEDSNGVVGVMEVKVIGSCLPHTGGIGIHCEEGREGVREARWMAWCLNVLCEWSNPIDLSISLMGGEETN